MSMRLGLWEAAAWKADNRRPRAAAARPTEVAALIRNFRRARSVTTYLLDKLRHAFNEFRRALHNRLHDGVFEIDVHSGRGRLRHENGDDFFFGIDEEVGAIRAAPTERTAGQQAAPLHRIVHDTDA